MVKNLRLLFGHLVGKRHFQISGENILPVSPNPTTATINRFVLFHQGEKPHRDVVLKTVERTGDIIRSFEALGVRATQRGCI